MIRKKSKLDKTVIGFEYNRTIAQERRILKKRREDE